MTPVELKQFIAARNYFDGEIYTILDEAENIIPSRIVDIHFFNDKIQISYIDESGYDAFIEKRAEIDPKVFKDYDSINFLSNRRDFLCSKGIVPPEEPTPHEKNIEEYIEKRLAERAEEIAAEEKRQAEEEEFEINLARANDIFSENPKILKKFLKDHKDKFIC